MPVTEEFGQTFGIDLETKPIVKPVGQALADLGTLYAERNKLYKNNYKFFGDVLIGLFPTGLTLTSEADFGRFALFVHLVTKITRYAFMFPQGGHIDSLDDIAVYAQMLQEYDQEQKTK